MSRTILLRVLLLLLVVAGTAIAGSMYRQSYEQGLLQQAGQQISLSQPLPLPEFSVVDDSGVEISLNSLRGRWSLLFFGYIHCPDICTPTMQQLSLLLSSPPELASGYPLQAVFVRIEGTTDSDYVPLADYLRNFNSAVRGFNYMPPELAASFGVSAQQLADGLYDHSTSVFVISPEIELYAVLAAPHIASAISENLQKLDAWYVKAG